MKSSIARALAASSLLALAGHASAQISVYEQDGYQGRTFSTQQYTSNLERTGFYSRGFSAIVVGQRYQVCEDARFGGRCSVLRPGQYPSPAAMGVYGPVASVRPLASQERVEDADYAPMPVVAQDYRRRRAERLYEAEVSSARAVVGTPAQRCWMEREQVAQQASREPGLNLPVAAIGAVIGGILGHQVGGGSGKQIATVAGALGGAALGSQYGRNDAPAPLSQDVRRCDANPVEATPSYWDVTYQFRGREHRVQMARDPGRSVTVNRNGEPRV